MTLRNRRLPLHRVGRPQRLPRPEAVARRHALGLRTARENVADLCDPDSFREHGQFAVAAQSNRRPLDELRRQTPADGMVTGIGSNGTLFGPSGAHRPSN